MGHGRLCPVSFIECFRSKNHLIQNAQLSIHFHQIRFPFFLILRYRCQDQPNPVASVPYHQTSAYESLSNPYLPYFIIPQFRRSVIQTNFLHHHILLIIHRNRRIKSRKALTHLTTSSPQYTTASSAISKCLPTAQT